MADAVVDAEGEDSIWNSEAWRFSFQTVVDETGGGVEIPDAPPPESGSVNEEYFIRLSTLLTQHFEEVNKRLDDLSRSFNLAGHSAPQRIPEDGAQASTSIFRWIRQVTPNRCPHVPDLSVAMSRLSAETPEQHINSASLSSPTSTQSPDGVPRSQYKRQVFANKSMSWKSLGRSQGSSFFEAKSTAREMLAKRTTSNRMMYSFVNRMQQPIFMKGIPVLLLMSSMFSFLQTIPGNGLDHQICKGVDIAVDSMCVCETLVRFHLSPTFVVFFLDAYNLLDLCGCIMLFLRIMSICMNGLGEDSSLLAMVIVSTAPLSRLLRTVRYFEKFHLLLNAFSVAFEALPVLLFVQTILVLFFSSAMFFFEHEHNPNLDSLPKSLWFCLVTTMTVGYGEVVPETTAGYLVSSALMICGGLYTAIPFGIVGSAFGDVWSERDRTLLMFRFRQCLVTGGYTPKDIPSLFMLFAGRRCGQLEMEDSAQMIREMKIGISEDRVVDLFNLLDSDGSGAIDSKEFVHKLFPGAYVAIFGNEETETGSVTVSASALVKTVFPQGGESLGVNEG